MNKLVVAIVVLVVVLGLFFIFRDSSPSNSPNLAPKNVQKSNPVPVNPVAKNSITTSEFALKIYPPRSTTSASAFFLMVKSVNSQRAVDFSDAVQNNKLSVAD